MIDGALRLKKKSHKNFINESLKEYFLKFTLVSLTHCGILMTYGIFLNFVQSESKFKHFYPQKEFGKRNLQNYAHAIWSRWAKSHLTCTFMLYCFYFYLGINLCCLSNFHPLSWEWDMNGKGWCESAWCDFRIYVTVKVNTLWLEPNKPVKFIFWYLKIVTNFCYRKIDFFISEIIFWYQKIPWFSNIINYFLLCV